MRRNQIILFTIFLVLTALIYMVLKMNKKEYSKSIKEEEKTVFVPVREVKNVTRFMPLTSYGQISPNTELIVSFEVQGKLQQGQKQLKPGTTFSKGQILYKIDNEEAFYTLSARKSSLTNLILNALPDIEMDFPAERDKWVQFMNDLNPANILPELPKINSGKERMFLTSRNILAEYYNLRSAEARMSKYLYVAPFSGTVVEIYAEPGSIVNPGGQIAKIAKVGDYEVKVPIDLAELENFKALNLAEFHDASGTKVGVGKIIRISDVVNQQTQSADVYYSITPEKGQKIYHGSFVNVTIDRKAEQETMALPRTAVKDGKVNILTDDQINPKEVLIVGAKPDTVFVSGLSNGQVVVLEQVEDDRKGIHFKGVTR